VALILQYLASEKRTVSALVAAAPRYWIVKAKVKRGADLSKAYEGLLGQFPDATADHQDGLRLAWADRWVHLRPSGTEPVIRMIAEAPTQQEAEGLLETCRTVL
jgi:phosphomannomutase